MKASRLASTLIVSTVFLLPRIAWADGPSQTAASCRPSWGIVPSPNVGSDHNYLFAVDADSQADAWAAGFYMTNNVAKTLIQHWDGASWGVIDSPNVADNTNLLRGVAALDASDVWAVGYSQATGMAARTLILHWDGTSWTVVPSPNEGTDANYLFAVSATSANDVWAAGFHYSGYGEGSQRTLILHWDGTSWTIVPSSNIGTNANYLYGVTAISGNDAWAVGYYAPANGSVADLTLALHWDGSEWSSVSSPSPGTSENFLRGVAATSSSDVQAVGYFEDLDGGQQPLTMTWNGVNWTVTGQTLSAGALLGVARVPNTASIAVGYDLTHYQIRTLIETWTGGNWKHVPSPSFGTGFNQLDGATATSSGDAWAVGFRPNSGNIYRTLIEHHCPLSGSPTS